MSDKLTTWANEPTVLDLKNDFLLAQTFHDEQESKIHHWRDVNNVQGNSKPKTKEGRSSVQPKVVRRQAEWRYSALSEPFLNSDKIFRVLPRTFEDEEAARQNELLLNYQFDTQLNKVKFIDEVVRTTVNDGTCIIRTGWDRATKPIPKEVPIYEYYPDNTPEYLQVLEQAQELSTQNPRGFEEQVPEEIKQALNYLNETGIPARAIPVGSTVVIEEQVINNNPTAEIIDNANVYLDPTCDGDINKALFIIISFETSKAELVKQGFYKNLDQINWDSDAPINDGFHESRNDDSFRFKDVARKKVVAYEYWGFYDINGDSSLVPIVATWIGNTMVRMEENPYPDGKLPFVFIPYLPIAKSAYGEPDAALLEDNQRIIGALTRGMIDLLGRSANSQQGIAKGMLDVVNERKFKSGEDYQFNPGFNPIQSYIEHKYPEIPQSALVLLQMQNQEAESLTGIKSFTGGISGDAYGQVAAGIRGALDSASKREMAILRRIAKGIADVGRKFIAMNSIFLSEKETIRVTNKQYIPINREDLKGNFDLKVDISTAEVDNEKAQDLGFMLQTIGPNLDPEITTYILAEIAELKRMPALAEKLRQWKPKPDPLAEQMKQLQVQEQELKNQKLQSEILLNQAKTQDTQTGTQIDLMDAQQELDGTKHQRDMEKQQAQARANQNLEVTKSLLKPLKEGEKAPDVEAAIGYNVISPELS